AMGAASKIRESFAMGESSLRGTMRDTEVPDRGDRHPRIPHDLNASEIASNHARFDRPGGADD
ncbi:MAG: hypothetical protein Q7T60_03960, partial [Sphingopyxis sp.]|nr:hypothetical protein [Sphingopyxis sp.]